LPAISIIIPVYNAEKDILFCLNSLKKQTFQDIEIICVNDGSRDHSLAILTEYAQNHSHIHILDIPNGGPGRARNLGVKAASGTYLLFLDSDDWITPHSCELLFKTAQAHQLEILQFQYFNACGRETYHISDKSQSLPDRLYNKVYSTTELMDLPLHTFYMWDKLWLRSFFTENNLFNLEGFYYEEVGSILKMISLVSRYLVIQEPLYYHFSSSQSISGTIPGPQHLLSRQKELLDIISFFREKDLLSTPFGQNIIVGELKQVFRQPWSGTVKQALKPLIQSIMKKLKSSLLPSEYSQLRRRIYCNKTYLLYKTPGLTGVWLGNTYRLIRSKKIRNKNL